MVGTIVSILYILSTSTKGLRVKPIILDTSVLVAVFMSSEGNHLNAKRLADYLINENVRPRIPMHGYFEIACTLNNKKITGTYEAQNGITIENPLGTEMVDIDQEFFAKYFDPSLPYTKAGDFIFLAIAKKDEAILITEDTKLLDKAVEAGVDAC